MWKRILACTGLIVLAVLISSQWWAAWGGRTTLGYELERARAPADVIAVATQLMTSADPVADDLLRRKARGNQFMAYEEQHRALVVVNPEDGSVHALVGGNPVAMAEQDGITGVPVTGRGQPVQEYRFVPKILSTPQELRAVVPGPRECWFVTRPADAGGDWYAVELAYQDGRCLVKPPTVLSAEALAELRNKPGWPRHWKR